jgi:uroporphyrin-III C-methyltransferase
MEAAKACGIEVEVIPGISSAIAVPASQMIPLTARGVNESFWSLPAPRSRAGFQKTSGCSTIVRHGSDTDGHEQAGRDHGYFCRLRTDRDAGSHHSEWHHIYVKMVIGTVRDIQFKAQYQGLSNPAVIVVGDVVKLHPSLVKEVAVSQGSSIVK